MSREVELTLVNLPQDVHDVWADVLRVSYPRLRLRARPTSPWKVHEVVETRARVLETGELALFAETGFGAPVTLLVPAREWSWRSW